MVDLDRMPVAALAVVVLLILSLVAAADDEPGLTPGQRTIRQRVMADLDLAKAKMRVQVREARAPILKRIDVRDDQARRDGNIAVVERIKSERDLFLNNGTVAERVMGGPFQKAIDAARAEMIATYDASIRELLVARVDGDVRALNAEREQLRGDRTEIYRRAREPAPAAGPKPALPAASAPTPPAPPAATAKGDAPAGNPAIVFVPPVARPAPRGDPGSLPPENAAIAAVRPVDPNLPPRRDFHVGNGTWFLDASDLVEVEEAGENFLLIEGDWENYDLQSRVMLMNGSRGVGFLWHVVDKANYDRVLIGANQGKAVVVETWKNGERSVLKELALQPAFQMRTWYDVQLKVRGRQVVVYLNGREIFRQADNAFARGAVGFAAPWGTIPRYRDIEVQATDGPASFRGLPLLRQWSMR